MTRYLGIIGYPLGHSISAAFQQAALDSCGIDARYEVWATPPDQVAQRMQALRDPSVMGANVTVPHKEAVLPYLDSVSELAKQVGAVNTIVSDGGRLTGYNTDVAGFMRALRDDAGFDVRGKRVLLLGAGGAAKAAAYGLLDGGAASLTIANRSLDRAQQLVESVTLALLRLSPASRIAMPDLSTRPLTEEALRMANDWRLIVNTTPIGMRGSSMEGQSPMPERLIPSGALVYDIVYNPEDTPLLQAARRRGARTLGGLPMLIYQGAEAFRLWTGQEAPIDVMFAAARKALGG